MERYGIVHSRLPGAEREDKGKLEIRSLSGEKIMEVHKCMGFREDQVVKISDDLVVSRTNIRITKIKDHDF